MVLNAAIGRRLALLGLLVVLGFLRAEQGVAELQGRQGEPSRAFRLVPDGDGYWSYAFLGWEGRVPSEIRLFDRGGPLLTPGDLPAAAEFLGRIKSGIADRLSQ